MAVSAVKKRREAPRGSGTTFGSVMGQVLPVAGAAMATAATGGGAAALLPAATTALSMRGAGASMGVSQEGTGPEASRAIQRRSDLLQEDPMQSLVEARQALAQSGIDPQTKAMLEAPILKALQSRRGM